MDVFRLITQGFSNAEIGQELFISDTTVKTHVTRLLLKLNVRDRVQAIVLAFQTGLSRRRKRPSTARPQPRRTPSIT
jgi:DNA-binding NarL/FixJ family response regulator